MESARAWAGTYVCEGIYDDLNKMLTAEDLDGVVIASWPALHCEQILACIGAGVGAVLCEKALVTNSTEATLVWEAAQRNGATVMEGLMYRHHPALRQLEVLAGATENGMLDSIHAVFNMLDETHEDGASRGWRRRADAGGGVAHDFLCYPVDAACHFAYRLKRSLPVSVQASGSIGTHSTIDRLFGLLEFDNGVCAVVESSRRASLDQRLEIRCEHSTLTLPFAWSPQGDVHIDVTHNRGFLCQESIRTTINSGAAHYGRLVDFPVFTHQMDNFVELIQGQAEPLVPLYDSIVNACVIDALLASAASGVRETVRLPASVA